MSRLGKTCGAFLLLGVLACQQSLASEAVSIVKVIDGDTFDVVYKGSQERIRLTALSGGVDTPETFQAECNNEHRVGKEATGFVRGAFAVAEEIILVTEGERGGFGRLLGRIEVDGVDLGDLLIAEGLAQSWPNEGNVWCQDSIGER